MLSSPNVEDLMSKVGNRYDVVLAVSKRARKIADNRIAAGSEDITDPVDVASCEIKDGVVNVTSKISYSEAAKQGEIQFDND